jgi:hypothetical protein
MGEILTIASSGLLTFALALIGIIVTLYPPDTERKKRIYLTIFTALGLIAVVVAILQGVAALRQARITDAKLDKFLTNTKVPEGYAIVKTMPPLAPPAMVGHADGTSVSSVISEFALRLNSFLAERGDPPQMRSGESSLDFINRSNGWYSDLMKRYNDTFAEQAKLRVRMLADEGEFDGRLQQLASDPQNPNGIKILAAQLQAAAIRLQNKGK